MRNILFLIFGLIILGCSKQSDKKDVWVSMNYMGDVDSLAELVKNGDSVAFDKLEIGTWDYLDGASILPYAFYMADKFHYSRAYYSVFFNLIAPHFAGGIIVDSINIVPIETKRLAIQYLKKGVDAGNYESISSWNTLIEKKLIDPNDYK